MLIVFFYYGNHPAITPRNRHSLTKASWSLGPKQEWGHLSPSLKSFPLANDEIHVAWQIHTESFLFLMVIKCDKVIYYIIKWYTTYLYISIVFLTRPSRPDKSGVIGLKNTSYKETHPWRPPVPPPLHPCWTHQKKKHRKTIYWLVVYLPLWKKKKSSSVGMMKFPIYGKS